MDEKPPATARVSRLTGSNLLGFADFGNPFLPWRGNHQWPMVPSGGSLARPLHSPLRVRLQAIPGSHPFPRRWTRHPLPMEDGARPLEVLDTAPGSCKDFRSIGLPLEEDTPLSIGARIFGTLAALLILFLLVGLLLPGSWDARAEANLPAPAGAVFPFLDKPERWALWMPLPSSGVEPFGPEGGPGAGIRWKDPHYGQGEFRILESEPGTRVLYQVVLEEGSLHVRGVITLSPQDGGTLLKWHERGDFGWNPLLGYAARRMARSQGEAMRSSLESLRELLDEGSS